MIIPSSCYYLMVGPGLKKQVFFRKLLLNSDKGQPNVAFHGASYGECYRVENIFLSLLTFYHGKGKPRDENIEILSKFLEGELVLLLYVVYIAA